MSAQSQSAGDSIELSAADAREVARLLTLLLRKELLPSELPAMLKDAPARADYRPDLVAKARSIFSWRKRRSQHFSPIMFSEAGWDMLLALYITEFEGGRQTIGKLVSWIGAPQTSALRWIDYLEKERLVSRQPHPEDRRRVFVDITEKGRMKLEDYLSTLPGSLSSG